jgi:protoporphyrinogen oxidase
MHIAVLGAGIAGLSAAYFLRRSGASRTTIIESDSEVGGLARSFRWHGFDCDLAPHRLYSQDDGLMEEITSLLPMHELRRRSRIRIGGKWINDPVNALELMLKFFPTGSWEIGWHYLTRRSHGENSFESLVLSRFGHGLNQFFFKPYSEKLFGIPADEISPEWGRRKIRIGGVRDMVRRNSKLYFRRFYYPDAGGYGAICQRLYSDVRDIVHLKTRVVGLHRDARTGTFTLDLVRSGVCEQLRVDAVISSLPLTVVLEQLGLSIPMRFRPAVITYLLVNRPQVTRNHWFYLADAQFRVNRVAEFKNFALDPGSLPPDRTVLCCEATNLDGLTVERVVQELASIGVLAPADVLDASQLRLDQAYPIYDLAYEANIARVRHFLAERPNLFFVGRNAQFEHKDVDEIFDEARGVAQQVLTLATSHAMQVPA